KLLRKLIQRLFQEQSKQRVERNDWGLRAAGRGCGVPHTDRPSGRSIVARPATHARRKCAHPSRDHGRAIPAGPTTLCGRLALLFRLVSSTSPSQDFLDETRDLSPMNWDFTT